MTEAKVLLCFVGADRTMADTVHHRLNQIFAEVEYLELSEVAESGPLPSKLGQSTRAVVIVTDRFMGSPKAQRFLDACVYLDSVGYRVNLLVDNGLKLPPRQAVLRKSPLVPEELTAETLDRAVAAKSDDTPLKEPVGVAVPTQGYVRRFAEEAGLAADILGSAGAVGVISRLGMIGMGGIGKSMLAAVVVTSPAVRRMFPDGIQWLELGREASPEQLLSRLIRQLTNRTPQFSDEQQGCEELRLAVEGRRMLLVLDDVWKQSAKAAYLLMVLGKEGRVLVTSRDEAVAEELGASAFPLGLADPNTARRILAEAAQVEVQEVPAGIGGDLAKACGYLPLALSMVGGLAGREKRDWASVLRRLRGADWSAIDRLFSEQMQDRTAFGVVETTLASLPEKDREAYVDLAVLPEDEAADETVLDLIWRRHDFTELQRKALVRRFRQLHLVRPTPADAVMLHDVQSDYVRKRAEADLVSRHAELFALAAKEYAESWDDAPTYFLRHLPFHGKASGKFDLLRALLFDYGWLRGKIGSLGIAAAAADFRAFFKDAEVSRMAASLELSAHAVAADPGQLANQLFGRLGDAATGDLARVAEAAKTAARSAGPALAMSLPRLRRPGGPLLRTYPGHVDEVTALLATADEKLVVSGGTDGLVRISEIDTGAQMHKIEFESGVVGLALLDGDRQLAVLRNNALALVNMKTGEVVRDHIDGVPSSATHIAAFPNETRVVIGCKDGRVLEFNLTTGQVGQLFKLPDVKGLYCLAVSSRHVMAGLYPGKTAVWARDGGLVSLFQLPQHHQDACACFFLDGEEVLVVSDVSGSILKGRLGSNELQAIGEGPSFSDYVQLSDWTVWLYSDDGVGGVDLNNSEFTSADHVTGNVSAMLVLGNHGGIVTGERAGLIRLWPEELPENAPRPPAEHGSSVFSVEFSPNGCLLLSSSLKVPFMLWRIPDGSIYNAPFPDAAKALGPSTFVRGGKAVAWRSNKEVVITDFDGKTLDRTPVPVSHNIMRPSFFDQIFSFDGAKSFAYFSNRKLVRVDFGGREFETLTIGRERIAGVSANGRRLVLTKYPNQVGLVQDFDHVSWVATKRGIRSAAISPDGSRVVLGGRFGLSVMDFAPNAEPISRADNRFISHIKFFPDNRHIVTCGYDYTVRVWDADAGVCKAVAYLDDEPRCAAVSPDGRLVAVGDALGRIHFFDVVGIEAGPVVEQVVDVPSPPLQADAKKPVLPPPPASSSKTVLSPDEARDLRRLVFNSFGQQRFTQDSPILPDVWMALATDPTRRLDVLITPWQGAAPSQLAQVMRAVRGEDIHRLRLAYNRTTVAAEMDFHDLLTLVVPLTDWWSQLPEHLRDLTGNNGSEGEDAAVARELVETSQRSFSVNWEFFRFVALVAFIEEQRQGGERMLTIDALSTEPTEAIARRMVELYLPLARRVRACWRDWPDALAWMVTENREATLTVAESRKTIKADAAELLFHISTRDIAWAIIDSGIDARHPAFTDWGKVGRSLAADERNLPASVSRVAATYDFTRLRDLLSDPWSSPLAETMGEEHMQTLTKRIEEGREVGWDLLLPLIRVSHDDGEYVPPQHPHGTHVAGILGGDWPADINKRHDYHYKGVCPDIRLYDLRVCGANGLGDEFAVMSALQFVSYLNRSRDAAVIHGVNLSLSLRHKIENFACGCTPVCEECNRLVGDGVVVVAAAGNQGHNPFLASTSGNLGGYQDVSITDPGNAELVITVGATHRDRPHSYGVSYFSSRGPTGDGRAKPDLVAPGEKIEGPAPDCGSMRMDGTSQAAPHVSGAAAMLMARHRELLGRPDRIKDILCRSATNLGRLPHFQGAGLVDVLRALQSI